MNRIKQFIKKLVPMITVIAVCAMGGCAKDSIGSPCPDFGKSCTKTPINSWNYNN